MPESIHYPYNEINNLNLVPHEFILADHLNGFDQNFYNPILDALDQYAGKNKFKYQILSWQHFAKEIKEKYSNLDLVVSADVFNADCNWNMFENYHLHPELDYQNFICSFNGSAHVSRKLVTAALFKFNLLDPNFVSKNFVFTTDELDGNIADHTHLHRFYRKFFIDHASHDFFNQVISFGYGQSISGDHKSNIYNLEHKLTTSFVHLVSESLATSYVPSVTEKFLYSVVTRGLFITYGQPGWHQHIEKYYGFRKYDKIFDYSFDLIANPVERLIELLSMLIKFKFLTVDDWYDLYRIEQETVNYNYDHYYSGRYRDHYLSMLNER
jgi:hypothetical protein